MIKHQWNSFVLFSEQWEISFFSQSPHCYLVTWLGQDIGQNGESRVSQKTKSFQFAERPLPLKSATGHAAPLALLQWIFPGTKRNANVVKRADGSEKLCIANTVKRKYFMPTAVRVKIALELDAGDDPISEQWAEPRGKKRKRFRSVKKTRRYWYFDLGREVVALNIWEFLIEI